MFELTLDKIEEYLGQRGKRQGNEYTFACNKCREIGGDTRGDNLKFNIDKGVLYCFCDSNHSVEILKDMARIYKDESNIRHETYIPIDKYKEVLNPSKQALFLDYMHKCNNELLSNSKALDYLEVKRGINKDTVKSTYMGIDTKQKRWVIPNIKYNTDNKLDIINFEYRNSAFQKDSIRKEKDCPTGLIQINQYSQNTTTIVVLEGCFDSMVLYQYLKEIGKLEKYHIVTPSNGVNSLLKQIEEINFTKYKHFDLYIDNDNVSRPIAKKIIEKYPMFNDIVLDCNCKDFNEHYLNCIKAKKQ